MEFWKEQEELKKKRLADKKKWPMVGTIVKYDNEYGVLVKDEDTPGEYLVRWDTKKENDYEQFAQLEYSFPSSYEFKYINSDGSLK